MMSEWVEIELGQFIELKRGYDLPKKNREEGTVPLVSSSGESDFHNVAKVKGPGVVTGRYGTIGQVSYVEEDFWPLNTTLYVKDFKGNAPLFVYYFLKTISYRDYSDKAAVPGINRNHLHKAEIRVPVDSVYQRELAEKLWALDSKIELNRQINQTLEQIAQAIFKSWFVDFEPVKAKVEAKQKGQDPELAAMCTISGKTEEQLKALDDDVLTQLKTTAALFPDALVESELGVIPEGWDVKPFGELLTKTIGGDWGKEERDDKHTVKVKILRGTDLPNVYAGNDGKVPTRFVDPKKLATRKLESGDIVIEVSGGSPTQPTGRSLYLTEEIIRRLDADLEPASFCRLFRPVDIEVGLMLGLHLQKIYEDGKTWLYQNTSTGISNFQTKVFLEKELVVVPSSKIKCAFYEMAMPYLKKISSGENKILAELRDTLLPKLLSGELSFNREEA